MLCNREGGVTVTVEPGVGAGVVLEAHSRPHGLRQVSPPQGHHLQRQTPLREQLAGQTEKKDTRGVGY
eukprot:818526-Prorocentrum_minimum.AAC.4